MWIENTVGAAYRLDPGEVAKIRPLPDLQSFANTIRIKYPIDLQTVYVMNSFNQSDIGLEVSIYVRVPNVDAPGEYLSLFTHGRVFDSAPRSYKGLIQAVHTLILELCDHEIREFLKGTVGEKHAFIYNPHSSMVRGCMVEGQNITRGLEGQVFKSWDFQKDF